MQAVGFRAWLVTCLLGLCACGDTRIRVTIEGDGALVVDNYQVRVADRLGIGEPRASLDLLVSDELAGAETTVELWGLYAGQQVAYGKATVTPSRKSTVDVTVTMGAVACGMWCQPGTRSCDGDATRECVQVVSGCLEQGAASACPTATPFCSNGECGTTCTDECSSGMSACDGAVAVRTCGQFDSDDCMDWSAAMSCAANQRCTDGGCATSTTCANTGDECDDGDGCTDGDMCSGSMCEGEPRDCNDEPPRCVSPTTLRMYGGAGVCSAMTGECSNSYVDASCKRGCANDACAPYLAAGGNNSCAIKPNGTLACWGEMADTQLPIETFTAISIKHYHGCGTTTAGGTKCWSTEVFGNSYGELDVPMGTTFKAVSAGDGFSCGIMANSALDCWGDSLLQQLAAPTGTFVAVSSGTDHSCAIRTDGTAACWGLNSDGQRTAPGGSFTRVAAGYKFSCGLRPGGAIECWGTIAGVIPPGSFVELSAGFDHACALRADGVVKCWGANTMGKATPPTGAYSSVAVGNEHSCGTHDDGTIECWGDATQGARNVPAGL